MKTVSRHLAQQIVETVKDVCGYDINFINEQGIIFASTDSERIGNYHEIGHQVARSGETIEVCPDSGFEGTNRGVNLPVFHQGKLAAVIGISGEPDQVRKYGVLAEKITRILIREQELTMTSRSLEEKRNYIVKSLLFKEIQNMDYLKECMEYMKVEKESVGRVIDIRIRKECAAFDVQAAETAILKGFSALKVSLYSCLYPKEYVGILSEESFRKNREKLLAFAESNVGSFQIGVGNRKEMFHLDESYQAARTALESIRFRIPGNLVFYDDLTWEIVFAGMDERSREEYINKMIGTLEKGEITLLSAYYETGQSLQKTSEMLFIHKNTLQNRLNRIGEKIGYDPRKFRDAAAIYMACLLWNKKEKKLKNLLTE